MWPAWRADSKNVIFLDLSGFCEKKSPIVGHSINHTISQQPTKKLFNFFLWNASWRAASGIFKKKFHIFNVTCFIVHTISPFSTSDSFLFPFQRYDFFFSGKSLTNNRWDSLLHASSCCETIELHFLYLWAPFQFNLFSYHFEILEKNNISWWCQVSSRCINTIQNVRKKERELKGITSGDRWYCKDDKTRYVRDMKKLLKLYQKQPF